MALGFDIAYLVAGAVGGIIMGVIGTGSSLIILPVLIFIFPAIFPETQALHSAVGTTVAALFVGTCSGAVYCIKQRLFDKKLIVWLTLPLMAGALLAPVVSGFLPVHILAMYIAGCIFTIGVYNLCRKPKQNHELKPYNLLFSMLFAFFNSIVSGVAGVALGILMIPYLTRHLPFQQAKGTNIILGVFYALFAAIGYVWTGWGHTGSSSWGYIYLPAFIFSSISMLIFPVIGGKLSETMPAEKLQKAFYSFLLVASIVIFVQAF